MATILLAQLERKFGQLPETAVQRVRGAPTSQLESWAARVLTESSLDRVLA